MEQRRLPIFADRFANLRGDMTQEEFAKFLGISRPTVGFYENGTRVPDALVLRQIAEKCEVSTDWLLGLSGVRTVDRDVRMICEYTGLSEEAVNIVHIFADTPGDGKKCLFSVSHTVNLLLQNTNLYEATRFLFQAVEREAANYAIPVLLNKPNLTTEESDLLNDIKSYAQYVKELAHETGQSVISNKDAKEYYLLKAKEIAEQAIVDVFERLKEEIDEMMKSTS